MCCALNLYFLYHLESGTNSNGTEVKTNIMLKSDNNNAIITLWHCCSSFMNNKFEQIEYLLLLFTFR